MMRRSAPAAAPPLGQRAIDLGRGDLGRVGGEHQQAARRQHQRAPRGQARQIARHLRTAPPARARRSADRRRPGRSSALAIGEPVQRLHHVVGDRLEPRRIEAGELVVPAGARVRLGGQVDGHHLGRAGLGGVDRERAGVREQVEHAPPGRARGHRRPAEPHVREQPHAERRGHVDAEPAAAVADHQLERAPRRRARAPPARAAPPRRAAAAAAARRSRAAPAPPRSRRRARRARRARPPTATGRPRSRHSDRPSTPGSPSFSPEKTRIASGSAPPNSRRRSSTARANRAAIAPLPGASPSSGSRLSTRTAMACSRST